MRTTVDIDAKLLHEAKRQAADRSSTLSEVVQRALRQLFESERRHNNEPFELVEAGRKGGRFPSPAEIASLLDRDDLDRLK